MSGASRGMKRVLAVIGILLSAGWRKRFPSLRSGFRLQAHAALKAAMPPQTYAARKRPLMMTIKMVFFFFGLRATRSFSGAVNISWCCKMQQLRHCPSTSLGVDIARGLRRLEVLL